ncbi:MAG: TonB-dependent hemoglobin/transferrin/lactoferrin family receptor [Aquamicrobium sp.]|uniref:TonB-dependent hemoglobin/transferrin/lactoferrin family receptor n=1 Tax=Aquamicrobium sp. TaxID=1872579 RepID=UPI00349E5867|nr:TonB-dependent hemoglobin/transferrin/lactoferrin family receptor [Aquamicrobium sp.]
MKAWHSRAPLMACTALAMLYIAIPAAAQDSSTVLETIEVEGKKTSAGQKLEKGAADTPLASETTADDIRKKEISDLGDLGNTTEPGVDYTESQPGKVGGLTIRGLGGPRIATVIDGIPISSFGNLIRAGSPSPMTGISDGTNSFDFSSLSAIDVVRGADSSRLGAGALAGGLLMRTLEPDDLIEDGRDWGGISKVGYDSSDRSVAGSLAIAKRFESTSFLFQGAYKKGHERDNKGTDDIYGVTRTKPNPADIDQSNLLFKVRHDLEGGHRIGMTAERYRLDNDFELKTMQNSLYQYDQGWGFESTHRDRVSLDYRYEAPSEGGLIDAAALTLYWQKLNKNAGSDGIRTSDSARYLRDNDVEESSYGLTGGLLSTFNTGNLAHEVRFGGTLQFLQTEQFMTGLPASSVLNKADMPHVSGTKLGLYLDDRIGLGDSGFALTPGLRLDWYDYEPKAAPGYTGPLVSKDGMRISPKLLATYQMTPQTELFAQWSMAYRAPSIDEYYIYYPSSFYEVRGNIDLKPETGHGFEIGANYESGDLSGKLTVFHNRYRNFIEGYQVSGAPLIMSWRNVGEVEISGIELKARKDFANGFYLSGALSYAYGKNKTDDTILNSIAPFKAIIGIGYERENWGVDLTGIFAGHMREDGPQMDPQTGTPYETFDAPGYGIANLTGWWEPEQVKGLRIQAGVYNLFDRKYWNGVAVRGVDPTTQSRSNQPVDFYSEPGRTFKVSLTHKF